MTSINFDELIGTKAKFYGVDGNMFKLGKVIFEVIEDEEDGYRSSMEEVRIVPDANLTGCNGLLAEVTIQEADGELDGYKLIDGLGHCWLEFGTNNSDDYYPSFTFYYSPRTEFYSSLKEAINKEC